MQRIMFLQKINIKLKFFIILITLLLTACATVKNDSIPIEEISQSFNKVTLNEQLYNLSKWQASGVIGIKYDNKADSANFIWDQDGGDFHLKIYGPLGMGAISVIGDGKSVSLVDSKGDVTKSKDISTLLAEKFGWYIPIEGLKYWIKGTYVAKETKEVNYSKLGLVDNLKQSGWEITYKDYMLIDKKVPLPSKIVLSRDDLTLKIVIKSWQV